MSTFWKPNTLFCEGENKELSIGRVTLWLTLIPAIHLWWTGEDIQSNHLYVIAFLLSYNFGKKLPTIVEPFISLVKAWKGVRIEEKKASDV